MSSSVNLYICIINPWGETRINFYIYDELSGSSSYLTQRYTRYLPTPYVKTIFSPCFDCQWWQSENSRFHFMILSCSVCTFLSVRHSMCLTVCVFAQALYITVLVKQTCQSIHLGCILIWLDIWNNFVVVFYFNSN